MLTSGILSAGCFHFAIVNKSTELCVFSTPFLTIRLSCSRHGRQAHQSVKLVDPGVRYATILIQVVVLSGFRSLSRLQKKPSVSALVLRSLFLTILSQCRPPWEGSRTATDDPYALYSAQVER